MLNNYLEPKRKRTIKQEENASVNMKNVSKVSLVMLAVQL